ncbi:sodium/proton antiporter, CPA1 family [Micromonospora purpureochromogenes]|uniref:Sodium/proton antiporter, CPA1 family n=1 Tax=Micromonospora purpureochromogenes TaxID=47872 RepID=A0A1C4YBP7_9ACTN|nr:cation:proton antiporter [Micromonospora purpureochromogenes]SCF18128.1 sodium/proton antiporter, CPA1 family [Micromonospora purpureochromogenes]
MLLLSFAAVLLAAVLVSALAHRTILSTAALFLLAGFVLGEDTTGVLHLRADSPIVAQLAELALFAVLFTDGMRVGWADLRAAWRLPGRALGWGLPLTLLVTAVLAHFVAGLDWPEALLVGAILAPTDPVFAAALVGNDKVPARLRHLLNVESGVNDGLALPFVVVLLAVAAGSDDLHLADLGTELAIGLLIGVLVPLVAIALERTRWFAASTAYAPLNGVAIGLLVLALGKATHGNLFLAAFAAGITVATFGPRERAAFEHFGENVAELLKLAALLVFGALISVEFLGEISWTGWVFAVLAIVVARPIALWISFLRSGLSLREQAAAMWFGPKGFASVVYGLLVLESGIAAGDEVFHLVALTIVISILAHSSTDVVIARAFDEAREVPAWHGTLRRVRRSVTAFGRRDDSAAAVPHRGPVAGDGPAADRPADPTGDQANAK